MVFFWKFDKKISSWSLCNVTKSRAGTCARISAYYQRDSTPAHVQIDRWTIARVVKYLPRCFTPSLSPFQPFALSNYDPPYICVHLCPDYRQTYMCIYMCILVNLSRRFVDCATAFTMQTTIYNGLFSYPSKLSSSFAINSSYAVIYYFSNGYDGFGIYSSEIYFV